MDNALEEQNLAPKEQDPSHLVVISPSVDHPNHARGFLGAVGARELSELRPLRLHIGGVPIDRVRTADVHRTIAEAVAMRVRPPFHIVTPNLDYVALARHDAIFRSVLKRSALSIADGMPLVWLSRLAGTPVPERVTGADLVAWLLDGGLPGARLFLFGSSPDVAAAVRIRAETNGVAIVGALSPTRSQLEDDAEALCEEIQSTRPDVLIVCLGAPIQDCWVALHRQALAASVVIGAGGSLDLAAGVTGRAPARLQAAGMEWAYRLVQEPRRLWRRYILRDVPVLCTVTLETLATRIGAATTQLAWRRLHRLP